MTITFSQTQIDAVLPQYLLYTASLRLVDTYWEDYICDAAIYDVFDDERLVGNFSYHEGEEMLSSFFVCDEYISKAIEIFGEVLEAFSPVCAYVVTNDELMLSLCMEYQIQVRLQAFFFDDTNAEVAPPEFKEELLRIAVDDDLPDIMKLDFFHPLYINNEEDLIYVMRDETGKFMGAGHICRMRLARQWGAVGMAVVEEYRHKGVGRSIILHLKEITKKRGLIPIAGCWCKNEGSKKTLEAAGFASKTRLLKVFFKEQFENADM